MTSNLLAALKSNQSTAAAIAEHAIITGAKNGQVWLFFLFTFAGQRMDRYGYSSCLLLWHQRYVASAPLSPGQRMDRQYYRAIFLVYFYDYVKEWTGMITRKKTYQEVTVIKAQ